MAWVTPTDVDPGDAILASLYNQDVVANTNALYDSVRLIDSRTQGSTYTVNQTTVSGASDVFSTDITFTAVAATYIVEFCCSSVEVGAGLSATNISLTDGGNNVLVFLAQLENNNSAYYRCPIHVRQRVTFTAGSKTINVRATKNNNNGALYGTAAGFTNAPIQLYLYGPDIT